MELHQIQCRLAVLEAAFRDFDRTFAATCYIGERCCLIEAYAAHVGLVFVEIGRKVVDSTHKRITDCVWSASRIIDWKRGCRDIRMTAALAKGQALLYGSVPLSLPLGRARELLDGMALDGDAVHRIKGTWSLRKRRDDGRLKRRKMAWKKSSQNDWCAAQHVHAGRYVFIDSQRGHDHGMSMCASGRQGMNVAQTLRACGGYNGVYCNGRQKLSVDDLRNSK